MLWNLRGVQGVCNGVALQEVVIAVNLVASCDTVVGSCGNPYVVRQNNIAQAEPLPSTTFEQGCNLSLVTPLGDFKS